MTKFNFLEARTKLGRVVTPHTTMRRPGIGKIIAELELEHPTWSSSRIEARAKAIWSERNLERRKA